MPGKILCVAEKPSIAKAVAGHLSGGQYQTSNTGNTFIKNYTFNFDFGALWGNCNVVMTCVSGHLTEAVFPDEYKKWDWPPPEALFDAPVHSVVHEKNTAIATNITQNARGAKALFIWTDCDREGEHIGSEVRAEALKGNGQLEIKRARFSNIERAHVLQAARNPVNLDDRQADAVAARMELDLRIGFAFTRFQTIGLRALGGPLSELTLSYGSCQFPTLGFVVERYFRVKNFVPETFWSIKITHNRDNIDVVFNWRRVRLFDRAIVVILFERCILAKTAKVIKVQEKPTKKWKPYPLTTIEFQKLATRFLRIDSHQAMTVAEALYNKGFISYPRTETDRFDKGMDLKALVEKQTPDHRWGNFARNLINGNFKQPREGRHDDKAHPPIHPVAYCAPNGLNDVEGRVYELITRRFLACCSDDAKGQQTDVEIEYGIEIFHTHGLIVLERNYLEVYPYENWTNSSLLPKFTLGERFEPTEAIMNDGKTSPPEYLTEPDLLALMDANGIGTDATMAEHIAKIKERKYVLTRPKGGGGRGGIDEFIPSTLGVALVDGYDRMEFETSLSKPFLRKQLELKLKDICDGNSSKNAVLRESLRQYRNVFMESKERLNVLKSSCRKYVLGQGRAA